MVKRMTSKQSKMCVNHEILSSILSEGNLWDFGFFLVFLGSKCLFLWSMIEKFSISFFLFGIDGLRNGMEKKKKIGSLLYILYINPTTLLLDCT